MIHWPPDLLGPAFDLGVAETEGHMGILLQLQVLAR